MREASRCYTPYDPETPKTEETLIFVFVNQAARDIRNKLVKLEGLWERSIRDLMMMAERVFYTRKSAEEKEIKKQRRQEKSLTLVLEAQQERHCPESAKFLAATNRNQTAQMGQ